MVTNKHNDSLIFPKGGWETDETAAEAAARETMEEAGVRGDTSPLGDFAFDSKMKDGKKTPCVCSVFVMNVTEEMEVWREQREEATLVCPPGGGGGVQAPVDARRAPGVGKLRQPRVVRRHCRD